ncbi:hypothetical protein GCM10007103_25890 [Salinimicrobium marinum]|uniref:Uncharacterized protein n=1 Tax=Salinimicrobium marinum TaxID=680283 RepID=A0A918SI17_9FLAO|nr:hypothetical protein [Salinimicrobium marinum]GHA43555.1 hypothetical protein GCM10007103_25890 [Salinimicrobium marinum]
MSLKRSVGNTIIQNQRSRIENPLEGIEIDYYFMASRVGGSKTEISLKLWTIIVDAQGYVYAMHTKHMGHFEEWETTIHNRMHEHLLIAGVDPLMTKRLLTDIEIKKDGHLIKWDTRCGGDYIGIDGSNNLYIRKNRFTYVQF